MKVNTTHVLVFGLVLIGLLLVALLATAPKHPVAMFRVVDAAGKPVAGATILPEGLRTKAGPYAGRLVHMFRVTFARVVRGDSK